MYSKMINEEDYLMISGIQHFDFLQKTVGSDSYRTAVGRKCSDGRGKNKAMLQTVIEKNLDSLRFYRLGKNYKNQVETIGIKPTWSQDDVLVL